MSITQKRDFNQCLLTTLLNEKTNKDDYIHNQRRTTQKKLEAQRYTHLYKKKSYFFVAFYTEAEYQMG